jgi:glycosyltransferase involved in cell wall biosynthesis
MDLLRRLDAISDLPTSFSILDRTSVPTYSCPVDPALSVIIPTFNPCHWLLEALASIERFKSNCTVEVLIIDDGSTCRESIDLLNRLAEIGYPILRKQNGGLSSARNLGFRMARADLILPLDDDNRLLSPYFTEGIRLLKENPTVQFVYGCRYDFGARKALFRPGKISLSGLTVANTVDACALIRKSLWDSLGGYDESLDALEDWDFWLSAMSINSGAAYIQQPCFEYRVRENSMLHKHLNGAADHRRVIEYLRAKHHLEISSLL